MGRLKAGTRIERYVVEGALGEGGMARVYRVRHETLGTEKALKVLTLTARDVRNRLLQEGRVQATLAHDNIVKVEDVLTVKGAPALLMELVDGPDMEGWLTRYQPTLDESLTLFRGICAGVGTAHSTGLIHRDLKPANILLALSGTRMVPKVTDFGLAKDTIKQEDFVDARGKTRTGATMGTPTFMAPEQIRDASQVDRRADMWSLGCILYRLACGVGPFEGEDIIELFNIIATGDYIPPGTLRRDLPPRVIEAIEALLEPDPVRRLADCAELVDFLDGRVESLGERTLVPLGELRDSPPPNTEQARWLAADSEASKIARELVDETLSDIPKLRRSKSWMTPAPSERSERPESRKKKRKKRDQPSQTISPPEPDQDTQVPATPPPPARGSVKRVAMGAVVLSLLGGVGLVLVVGGFVMWQLGVFNPPEVVETDTPHVVPPTPPSVPVPVPVRPVAPTPSPTDVAAPVAPVVQPDPVSPAPAVPTPTPAPAQPAAAGALAEVSYSGAKLLWLEPEGGGAAERDLDGVPPGRYRVMALFEGEPGAVMAGRVTLREGQKVTIKCHSAFQQCKP